ncbi:MAG TPA: hypothetical protein GX497_03335 [Bacillus bacterium]|nr:hypothetical protein [Bacillus sp. (in: firmicutes)]
MLNQLLKEMYNKNIQIEVKEKNTLNLIYEQGVLTPELKQFIKKNKQQLIKRLKENDAAQKKGFLVYEFGMLYEYRYGLGAFLFIERNPEGSTTSWRANYGTGDSKPYKIKFLRRDVDFEDAYREAANFVDWLKKKRRAG